MKIKSYIFLNFSLLSIPGEPTSNNEKRRNSNAKPQTIFEKQEEEKRWLLPQLRRHDERYDETPRQQQRFRWWWIWKWYGGRPSSPKPSAAPPSRDESLVSAQWASSGLRLGSTATSATSNCFVSPSHEFAECCWSWIGGVKRNGKFKSYHYNKEKTFISIFIYRIGRQKLYEDSIFISDRLAFRIHVISFINQKRSRLSSSTTPHHHCKYNCKLVSSKNL